MIRLFRKFNLFLNGKQKIHIVILIILMVIGGLLETFGISMIVPLMTTIMNPVFFETNRYAVVLSNIFGLRSSEDFIVFILLALVGVYFIKNGFLFFEYYVQARFVCNNRMMTQRMMMDAYLHRPYEYFLSANSGEVIRVITNDVRATFHTLMCMLQFLTELIVSITLLVAVIAIDRQMAMIVVVVLAVEMLVIYKIIKPILSRAGINKMQMEALANKWTLQSISGIKEIKVSRKEKFFLKQYSKYANQSAVVERRWTVLDSLPRLLIEAFTISAMLFTMVILIKNGKPVEALLPQLAAFAMAAIRILPSANRMSSSVNAVAFSEPVLDKTIENLDALHKKYPEMNAGKGSRHITFNDKCQLSDITFSYPNIDKNVLDHANLVIKKGETVGIIGTSGAGKTTAVDILLGLLNQQSGSVLSDGNEIKDNYGEWLSLVSYVPQIIFMLDDTIRANVAFGIDEADIDDEIVWRALEEAQLKDFVQQLPEQLNTSIGERGIRVSGGQRQRIGIARALYTNPELIIFDEATSALDNETETAIMEAIYSLHGKKTMIIIAHRLTTIEGCDVVYQVESGKIQKVR